MLRTLLWKDVRLNIVVLRIAALLAVLSYAGMALQGWTTGLEGRFQGGLISKIIWSGSTFSHMCLQFSLAILAANLIASERADGSAEFLTYLPLKRKEVLYSKGLLLVGVCVVASILHFMGVFAAAWLSNLSLNDLANVALGLLVISAAGFGASGIGWFASCWLKSNATALLVVIVGFPVINITSRIAIWWLQLEDRSNAIFISIWIGIGTAGFVWGTRHFLNRIEP